MIDGRGIRVYHQTYGGSLSQKDGSPIAETATLIGRAVKGVYNKVLNFRHIDPRDERAGFSGGGAIDREVWAEFYDASSGEIDADALEEEFRQLWGDVGKEPPLTQSNEVGSSLNINDNTHRNSYRPGPTPQAGEYVVTTSEHENWFVYVLALSNKGVVKVGMSHDPKSRLQSYNHTILPEITGLEWKLAFTHKVSTVEAAKEIEQSVLRTFKEHQLPSNGEILKGIDVMDVQLAIVNSSVAIDQGACPAG